MQKIEEQAAREEEDAQKEQRYDEELRGDALLDSHTRRLGVCLARC